MEEDKKLVKIKEPKFKMANDKLVIIIITAIILIVAGGLFGYFFYNNNLKAVVTFDGGKLTSSEYTTYYKIFAPMLESYGYPADIIPDEIANKAGVDKILLIKAKAEGVTLSAEDKAKVDETFKDAAQVKQFTDKGIDPGKMKELYNNDYIITAYMAKAKTNLTADEMKAYLITKYGEKVDMNEFVTRHILYKITDANNAAMTDVQKAEVKVKAEATLKRAIAGEDFAKLATELSEDAGTKINGGLYNVYNDEQTMAPYSEAVKNLTVGKITTTLVETTAGYHIIKLESINPNGRINSNTDRESLSSQKVTELSTSMHIDVKKDLIKKLVESITGVKAVAPATTPTTTTPTTTTP